MIITLSKADYFISELRVLKRLIKVNKYDDYDNAAQILLKAYFSYLYLHLFYDL